MLKTKLLLTAVGVGIFFNSFGQNTCTNFGPYVFSEDLTATGELLYSEVMILGSDLVPSTYASTMNFYIGPRLGYCGIQNLIGGERRNIFSMWDTQETNIPQCYAEYAAPNTNVHGFGGEGTGLHTDNNMNWTPGAWQATAIRRWYTGGNQTRVGFFMYNNSTAKWTHYVTMVTPEADAKIEGGSVLGFLENFNISGNNNATSVAYFKNTWSMNSSGVFSKPTRYSGAGGGGYWNAESAFNNNAIKITSCGTGQEPTTYPFYYLNQPGTKPNTAIPTNITSVTASYANSHVTVNWINSDYTSPQLSYTVKIYGSAGSSGPTLVTVKGTSPETRTVTAALPPNSITGTYWASVEVVDIFNQTSNFSYSSFNVNTVPVAGINTNIYYKIKNVASGLYLDVEGSSTVNNAKTPQKYSSTATSQQWKFQVSGSKYFLINRNSGKLLSIYATQYNQQWTMIEKSANTYIIESNMSQHRVVDNPGNSQVSGTDMIIWTQNSPAANNQLWVLEPVSNTLNARAEYPFAQTNNNEALAYPNPVRKGETVRFNLPTSNTNYKIKVTTTTGIVVVNTEVNGAVPELPTQNLQPGMYLFTLQGTDKNYTGKFVVE